MITHPPTHTHTQRERETPESREDTHSHTRERERERAESREETHSFTHQRERLYGLAVISLVSHSDIGEGSRRFRARSAFQSSSVQLGQGGERERERTHTQRERGRDREQREDTHTHTHTHTEREREREREIYKMEIMVMWECLQCLRSLKFLQHWRERERGGGGEKWSAKSLDTVGSHEITINDTGLHLQLTSEPESSGLHQGLHLWTHWSSSDETTNLLRGHLLVQ